MKLSRSLAPSLPLPVLRWVLKAPELRGGVSEAKANFGSAALFLT
jgi:hypothetical protein